MRPATIQAARRAIADGRISVLGIPCLGLNGGPLFKHEDAFQIATEDQEETDL